MIMPKEHRRIIVISFLALVGIALIMFTLWLMRDRDKQIREQHAKFYERVILHQSDFSGPPIAKVISADQGTPVSNVIIGMTLIGPDGGDGGFQTFVTDKEGIAHNYLNLVPGRYQYHLMPDPKSRFARTFWRRGQPYIIVSDDGTTSFPILRLNIKSNE